MNGQDLMRITASRFSVWSRFPSFLLGSSGLAAAVPDWLTCCHVLKFDFVPHSIERKKVRSLRACMIDLGL